MIDYEKALLGAILQGFKDIPALTRIVSGGDFYSPQHEWVWNAIVAVDATGGAVDSLAVYDKLGTQAGKLPTGHAYLSDLLTEGVPTSAEFYAEKVREAAVRRQIGRLGQRCQQMVSESDDMDPADMIARIQQWAGEVKAGKRSKRVDLQATMERVIDIAEHGEALATPTPWPGMNNYIGGWHPGHLIIVAARPGVGKTMMLGNATTAVLRAGRRVAFVSLEMTGTEVLQRFTADLHGIELDRLRHGRGNMNERAWQRLTAAHADIPALPLDLYDDRHQTLMDIRALAWESKREAQRCGQEMGLVVVDYLQLITARDLRLPRHLQVGEMSRGLKALAGELEVPVLAATQLNRQSEARAGKVPMLSDIRESGDVEQDADLVILMHEQTVEDQGRTITTGDVDLIIAKWRHGAQGVVTVQKYGHFGRLAA